MLPLEYRGKFCSGGAVANATESQSLLKGTPNPIMDHGVVIDQLPHFRSAKAAESFTVIL